MRDLSDELLSWYDQHARVMPWRIAPADSKAGKRPDPYFIWMSEVMLQQTTVAAVTEYFRKFTGLWPTVRDLAAADDADVMAAWAGLGYYARARNLLKCARVVVDEHGGVFPSTYDDLLTLPGVGPYTAAAVASIAFNEQATVLDGNVERVMARLYDVHDPLPGAKPRLMELATALTPADRPGDHAQAVMDLAQRSARPAIRPVAFASGVILVLQGLREQRRNCQKRPRKRKHRPGAAMLMWGGDGTGHGCWKRGQRRASWAGCWAFHARIGQMIRNRHPPCKQSGRHPGQRPDTPSRTSTSGYTS